MGNEIIEETLRTEAGNLHETGAELNDFLDKNKAAPGEILFVTSYPPRECGIASYAQNLINALTSRFDNYYRLKVCALENGDAKYYYTGEVTTVLNTSIPSDYMRVASQINHNADIQGVVIQHEFGLFKPHEEAFLRFLGDITKPTLVVFHTVIASPSEAHRNYVQKIANAASSILVMAKISASILINEYGLASGKIEVITYGTHLVTPLNVPALKEKNKLTGHTVLSTIGLLAPDRGIENTLEALPAIIKQHPQVMFLIVGKTHPEEFKKQGEKYRIMLEARVKSLKLQKHVTFLNGFFNTATLTEYFRMSDIVIFSCTDTDRPMSGMFSLAVSCGSTIVSTPTSHAQEFLSNGEGVILQNNNSNELANRINELLDNPGLRKNMSESILRKSHSAIWENAALQYGQLLNKATGNNLIFDFKYPEIKLDFLKSLTDQVGILHASYKGEADIRTGYTLDDNALALFVFCMHYKNTRDANDIPYIKKYLKFIYHCLQPSGIFFKYMDYDRKFTVRNQTEDLEETQGKAIWSLGYLYSMKGLLPSSLTDVSALILRNAFPQADNFVSGKAISFTIKGLYYYYSVGELPATLVQIKSLANKLVDRYRDNATDDRKWFESTFSDSASLLSNALLNAWLTTGENIYRAIAKESFEFLSSKFFNRTMAEVHSKQEWQSTDPGKDNAGEHPCDIGFQVITLSKFYLMCKESEYFNKMNTAYQWFLGNNRLNQMIYNPVTGSCYDGLEGNSVSLNQSAESALCYTLARLVVEKYKFVGENHINRIGS